MHISEGVLSPAILVSGAAVAALGTAIGLKRLDYHKMVRVALLTSVFYLASLVHVPVGPTSAHLILNGLVGLFLGWAAFPAILVGLILHAVLFQFGGLTTLGVNTTLMAAPAVICSFLYRPFTRKNGILPPFMAFCCGGLAVFLGAILLGTFLALNGEAFYEVAWIAVAAHLPVMIIEGFVAMFVIAFLFKVKPEVFQEGLV